MKSFISLSLVIVSMLLSGCGNSNTKHSAPQNPPASPPIPKDAKLVPAPGAPKSAN